MKKKTLTSLTPPLVKPIRTILEKHGKERIDNYYWLNERTNPDVIGYLKAENDYAENLMASEKDLEEVLFEEIKGRIKQTDLSVPCKIDDYFYYTRFEDGKEYPFFCRKRGDLDAEEELMLDVNFLAEGHEYFSIGELAVSFSQDILAYSYDLEGRRIYNIAFKNLKTGELLKDAIYEVTGNMAWANDNATLFYSKQDPVTLRSAKIFRHLLGSAIAVDHLVYEEVDETFSVVVFKTKSKKYIMIASQQTVSSEYQYLEADYPTKELLVFLPRERNHEYDVDHYQDNFYIRTNWLAKNFRLMKTNIQTTGIENWQEVVPHRNEVLLESFELFHDYLVLEERKQGLTELHIMAWSGEDEHYLDFGESTYWAGLGDNQEFHTKIIRYVYSSLTTPHSVYDYRMDLKEKTLLKQEEVLGDFNSANYDTQRIWADAEDGTKIPISMVYRKDIIKKGKNPLLLYGYGSYGLSMDANFSSPRLSLLDRGFVFAIAHIRGGEELGRAWYEKGKLLEKKNTFTDFIACGEYLVRCGYTNRESMFAMGGSAGGLLMGVVLNMRPDLFEGVVAQVPFVDMLTTMLDPSIPLTAGEYDEWGNPNTREYYDYMLSYSPYDNVVEKAYPHLLVTAGLYDSQVQYWEPAKWVAKLRINKTDDNFLLLRTNMDAGHSGSSGRFRRYKELAFIYTFLLHVVGMSKA